MLIEGARLRDEGPSCITCNIVPFYLACAPNGESEGFSPLAKGLIHPLPFQTFVHPTCGRDAQCEHIHGCGS